MKDVKILHLMSRALVSMFKSRALSLLISCCRHTECQAGVLMQIQCSAQKPVARVRECVLPDGKASDRHLSAATACSRLALQEHVHMHTSNNPAFPSKNNTHTERLHPHTTPRRQRHTDRCMVGQTRGHCRPHTVAQHTGSGREGKTAGCSGNQRRDGFSL